MFEQRQKNDCELFENSKRSVTSFYNASFGKSREIKNAKFLPKLVIKLRQVSERKNTQAKTIKGTKHQIYDDWGH